MVPACKPSTLTVRPPVEDAGAAECWLCNVVIEKLLCEIVQDDENLHAKIVEETKSYKEPVRVINLKDKHHALDLWENICQTPEDLTKQPPILLLPEGYDFVEDKAGSLAEMGRLYKANELVSVDVLNDYIVSSLLYLHCHLSVM